MSASHDYRIATPDDLEAIWELNIAMHPGDNNWVRWKKQFIDYNADGEAVTFVTVIDGKPVGEGTLLLSPTCKAVAGMPQLADGKTCVNLNALRIVKAHEGQGHISKMVRRMESWAKERGYSRVTIGVEAAEARNLGIYLHWGYDKFLCHKIEDGAMVLYYANDL